MKDWDAKKILKTLGITLLAWAGITLDLTRHGDSASDFLIIQNLLGAFRGFDAVRALLFPGLFLLFLQADRVPEKPGRGMKLLAAFLALQMVLGFSFVQAGDWSLLTGLNDGQMLKTLLAWTGWFLTLKRLLPLAAHLLTRAKLFSAGQASAPETPGGGCGLFRRAARMMRQHSFLTPLLILGILYLPHLLISFPAMFMGDTWSQIVQAYPELGMTGTEFLSPDQILRPGVFINQNHPVFHTLTLHLFLQIGDGVFRSFNAGIFLYALFQAGLLLTAFAWGISSLIRRNLRPGWAVGLLIWALVHPQIRNFLPLVTKDVPYAACFLLAISALFRLYGGERTPKVKTVLVLSVLGILLFRNEGRLVLLCAGLLMAVADKKRRRSILSFTAAVVLLSVGIFNLLYPALGFTPGSIREVLSVPFQQTARFVRDHGEEVTEEEREAIDGVLDYAALTENYDPSDADPVKATFRQEAGGEELLRYFRAWAGMLLRHPETYLQATLGNYYEYFYPGDVRMSSYSYGWSTWMCDYTNDRIEALGKSFSIPEWSRRLRYLSDSILDAGLLKMPLLSALMNPALAWWAVLILLSVPGFGTKRSKKDKPGREGITLLIPLTVMLLLLLFGPVNGSYGRYLLPASVSLPFLAMMVLSLRGRETEGAGALPREE